MTETLHRLNRLLWLQSPTGIPADRREQPELLLDLKLAEDFGFDSIDLAELWCAIEDEFVCDFAEAEMQDAVTIRDAVALIETHRGPQPIVGTRP